MPYFSSHFFKDRAFIFVKIWRIFVSNLQAGLSFSYFFCLREREVFNLKESFTRNTDFCESFQRNRFLLLHFSFNKVCTTLCIFASHFCKYFCKMWKIFVWNLSKTLLPLLFLSPGARKFLMLTKISQEIQIFAKAFREISFYTFIFQVIYSKIEHLFS
jgi:hypothetical protein